MTHNRRTFLARIGQQPGEPGRALKYRPEFCDRIRDLAQEGDFPEAWASELGVTLDTMRRWVHTYPEFKDATIIAHQLLCTFWGREIAKNRNHPNAKSAMYDRIIRRLPTLYGDTPVDLHGWMMTDPDAPPPEQARVADGDPATPQSIRNMTSDELEARLKELEDRRKSEG